MKITIPTIFYVDSVRNEDFRDPKDGIENSFSFSFVDNKKKPKNSNDWSPTTNGYITLLNQGKLNIKIGQKYKITLEEVE